MNGLVKKPLVIINIIEIGLSWLEDVGYHTYIGDNQGNG